MHHTFALLGVALALAACGEVNITTTVKSTDDRAQLRGGDPMPKVAADIQFPWMGKQSIMCVGNAFERQVAFVDFSPDEEDPGELGSAQIAADGSGTARFVVPTAKLRTGDVRRDTKLQSGGWLDAETHPEIAFEATSLKRVEPTLWEVEGAWTMRGVTKRVEFLANVRYVPEMQNVGKDVIRFSGRFDIRLKDCGIVNDSVGSLAVAEVWTVDVGLLGVMIRK